MLVFRCSFCDVPLSSQIMYLIRYNLQRLTPLPVIERALLSLNEYNIE